MAHKVHESLVMKNNNEKQETQRVEKLIDWKKIGAIIQKNFIVLTRDKTRLIPLLAFPLIMILVLGFTSGNTPKHINAAIVSYDDSALSQTIIQAVSGSQYFSVAHVVSTEGEARKLLDSGVIRVIIEIPPGLQTQIDSGHQQSITVIVDESDSAVAGTARQVLGNIVDGISQQLSMAKYVNYQQTTNLAATQLAAYANGIPNQYAVLSSQTNVIAAQLAASKLMINKVANTIVGAPVPPTRITIPANTTISYQGQEFFNANDTGYALEPTADNKQKAAASILFAAASSVDFAMRTAQSANVVASGARDQIAAANQDSYPNQITLSSQSIALFTQSEPASVLKPLVYTEKPAYGTGKRITDFLIPSLIVMTIFQGAVMGMGRAIAGEKREGSLTRVFLTPTSNTTIIVGTLLFYVIFEMLRASLLIVLSIILFDLKIVGSVFLIALILAIYISISTAIGMVLSSLVRTEQQFMAMAMLVSLPTMFLSGVFFPVQAMPKIMQIIANFLPVTYAGDALRSVMVKGLSIGSILYPLGILLVFLTITYIGIIVFFKRDVE